MLNGDGNKNWKKVNRLNSNKKNCARAAHFFCTFLCFVFDDHNVRLSIYTCYEKNMSYVLTKDFVACVAVRFFFHCRSFFTLVVFPC